MEHDGYRGKREQEQTAKHEQHDSPMGAELEIAVAHEGTLEQRL